MSEESGEVIRLDAACEALQLHFLGWQCRIRQLCVREAEGQPMVAMQPGLHSSREAPAATRLNTVLVPLEPEKITAELRHQVKRTHDPKQRRESALKYLAAHHYQYPEDFDDILTALFPPNSEAVDQILAASGLWLHFDQFNQTYWLPCSVHEWSKAHPSYQYTYWHNALFNPNIPGEPRIIGFEPDWREAIADPDIGQR